jgi:release factor glutamine methyltransferase
MTQAAAHDLLAGGMTVAQVRRTLADVFFDAGLDSPELDARILAGHALGLNHSALVAEGDRILSNEEVQALTLLAARRLRREPVARILGVKEFWGLPLGLGAATLVPRPETETVVEAALAAIDESGPRDRALLIADLGTGSGALLLALLRELPNATGVGTDMSFDALETAQRNAVHLGLSERARFLIPNFGAALTEPFDLVVSNPPYIASGDIAALPPEVRHDPRRALDGGADGLDGYRAIAGQALHLLKPGAVMVLELGMGQEDAVASIFRAAGLAPSPARPDLAGIPRALPLRIATIAP